MFYIVVYKFCHKQKLSLVVMPLIDKNLKIYLYYTIPSLCLAISLWMINYKELLQIIQ